MPLYDGCQQLMPQRAYYEHDDGDNDSYPHQHNHHHHQYQHDNSDYHQQPKTRQRSKTQPDLAAFERLAHDSPPVHNDSGVNRSFVNPLKSSHHPKSKSQYALTSSGSQPVTPKKLDRVLTAHERKQRRDDYSAQCREDALRKAREKTERAAVQMSELEAIRQLSSRPVHRRNGKLTNKRHVVREENGGSGSVGTQTDGEGWEMREIQDKLVFMLSSARDRLNAEIAELEDQLSNKENSNNGDYDRDAAAHESEEAQTERLTNLHTHRNACQKLEQQVLTVLDMTFTLMVAYGTNDDEDTNDNYQKEGTARKRPRGGERISAFDRFMAGERAKINHSQFINSGQSIINSSISGYGTGSSQSSSNASGYGTGLSQSQSTITNTLQSQPNMGSQSFNFLHRPSFQTLELTDRSIFHASPATAMLIEDDSESISPHYSSPMRSITVMPSEISSQLLTPATSPRAIAVVPDSSTPPHPRRLSMQQKQVLYHTTQSQSQSKPQTQSPKQPTVITYPTINEEKEPQPLPQSNNGNGNGKFIRHGHQPSIIAAPVNYHMPSLSNRFTHQSTLSGDLRVVSRGPSLLTEQPMLVSSSKSRSYQQADTINEDDDGGPFIDRSVFDPYTGSNISVSPNPPSHTVVNTGTPLPSHTVSLYQSHYLPFFLFHRSQLLYQKLHLYECELVSFQHREHEARNGAAELSSHLDALCQAIAKQGMKANKFHYHSHANIAGGFDSHSGSQSQSLLPLYAANTASTRARAMFQSLHSSSATRYVFLSLDGRSLQWGNKPSSTASSSSLSLATITVRVGSDCQFVQRLLKQRTTKGSKAIIGASDIDRCISFLTATRSLDLMLEHPHEVAIWEHIVKSFNHSSGGDSIDDQ